MALIHTSVTMLTSRHVLEKKKYGCGGHSRRGGLFTKQLKKLVKAVFLLGCYGFDKHENKSITQVNASNNCYVLDQHSNYMLRPLETIFRLHKIELEQRDTIYIVCATAYQC